MESAQDSILAQIWHEFLPVFFSITSTYFIERDGLTVKALYHGRICGVAVLVLFLIIFKWVDMLILIGIFRKEIILGT